MTRMNQRMIGASLVLLMAGGMAMAQLAGSECTSSALYNLTFGDQGVGSDSSIGSGLSPHGAFAYPPPPLIRLYDGDTGGSQQAGTFEIAYKNIAPNEQISDHIPNAPPASGSALFGGGQFDGTALWVAPYPFQAGSAPAICAFSSPDTGTRFDGSIGTAATGADMRPEAGYYVTVPVPTSGVETHSYVLSTQIYVPSHSADKNPSSACWTNRAIQNNVRVQPYCDRQGYGLTTPGGHGFTQKSFPLGQWNLLETRCDFVIDGGTTPASSDDSGVVTYTYFINGVQSGAPVVLVLDATQMSLRSGSINLGPGAGVTRGGQGDAPEFYLDDVSAVEVSTFDCAAIEASVGQQLCNEKAANPPTSDLELYNAAAALIDDAFAAIGCTTVDACKAQILTNLGL